MAELDKIATRHRLDIVLIAGGSGLKARVVWQ
jgi:hypothetical protein